MKTDNTKKVGKEGSIKLMSQFMTNDKLAMQAKRQ